MATAEKDSYPRSISTSSMLYETRAVVYAPLNREYCELTNGSVANDDIMFLTASNKGWNCLSDVDSAAAPLLVRRRMCYC